MTKKNLSLVGIFWSVIYVPLNIPVLHQFSGTSLVPKQYMECIRSCFGPTHVSVSIRLPGHSWVEDGPTWFGWRAKAG